MTRQSQLPCGVTYSGASTRCSRAAAFRVIAPAVSYRPELARESCGPHLAIVIGQMEAIQRSRTPLRLTVVRLPG
ncbi:MAG TPA: hypothetical protein VMK13_11945 [Streptosporangiaceae bacterium]|nr:hypothetical protein [Streptosporangiaceae bacterium]